MDDFSYYLKILLSLISIINPIGAIPIFLSLTREDSKEERNHTIFLGSLSVCIILWVSFFLGQHILSLFSISIPSFRVAGGLLILTMAFSMLSDGQNNLKSSPEERKAAEEKESIAVVPLALPLLTGPGTISTMIVFSQQRESWQHSVFMSTLVLLVGITVFMVLRLSPLIQKGLGTSGMKVMTRIMGLMLASIGVEFILNGIGSFYPLLMKG